MHPHISSLVIIGIEAIHSIGFAEKDNKVPGEFTGYIASFAGSVMQSGLLPTVVFYEEKPGNREREVLKTRRRKMTRALCICVEAWHRLAQHSHEPGWQQQVKDTVSELHSSIATDYPLLHYVRERYHDAEQLSQQVNRAAIALKLALRVFQNDKGDKPVAAAS